MMDGKTEYSAQDEIRDIKYYFSILDDQVSLYENAGSDEAMTSHVKEIASITKDMAFKCPTLRDPKLILTRVLGQISRPNKRKFVELLMLNWDGVTIKQTDSIQNQFRERIRAISGPM